MARLKETAIHWLSNIPRHSNWISLNFSGRNQPCITKFIHGESEAKTRNNRTNHFQIGVIKHEK